MIYSDGDEKTLIIAILFFKQGKLDGLLKNNLTCKLKTCGSILMSKRHLDNNSIITYIYKYTRDMHVQ